MFILTWLTPKIAFVVIASVAASGLSSQDYGSFPKTASNRAAALDWLLTAGCTEVAASSNRLLQLVDNGVHGATVAARGSLSGKTSLDRYRDHRKGAQMPAPTDSNDAPRIVTHDDSLTIQDPSPQQEPREARRQQRYTDLNARIRAAIVQMSAEGPEAEAEYQVALRALLREPGVTAAVGAAYRSTPEDQYIARWAHVHLLSELRDMDALSVLDGIVSTPIPPEKAPGMITYSTVGEEAMIRTTAIEGITRLALAGDRQAVEVLSKHTRHENLSVRRAAVQGYIEALGPDARDELRQRLPEADRFLVDIRRADVQEVPQPTIERPLEHKEQVLPPPAPTHTRLRPKIEE